MITRGQRMDTYTKADAAMAAAYDSLETAILLGAIREKYSISKGDFTDIVGDTILALRPRNSFEQSLITELELTPDVARRVNSELRELFNRATGTVLPDSLESRERLELHPDGEERAQISVRGTEAPVETTTTAAKVTEQEMTAEEVVAKLRDSEAKPLTREELMKALAGKRTMASDIEAVRKMREEDAKDL